MVPMSGGTDGYQRAFATIRWINYLHFYVFRRCAVGEALIDDSVTVDIHDLLTIYGILGR
jgi:hypothetical protein